MRRLLLVCIVAVCCQAGPGTRFEGVRHLRRHAEDGTPPRSGHATSRPLFSWDLTLAEKSGVDDGAGGENDTIPAVTRAAMNGTSIAVPMWRNKRRHGDELRAPGRDTKTPRDKRRRHLKKPKLSRGETTPHPGQKKPARGVDVSHGETTPHPAKKKLASQKSRHKKDKAKRREKKPKKTKKKKESKPHSVATPVGGGVNQTRADAKTPGRGHTSRDSKRQKQESIQKLLLRNSRRHEMSGRRSRPPGEVTDQVGGDLREVVHSRVAGDDDSPASNLVPDAGNKQPPSHRHSKHPLDGDVEPPPSITHPEQTSGSGNKASPSFIGMQSLDTESNLPPSHTHVAESQDIDNNPPLTHPHFKQPLDTDINQPPSQPLSKHLLDTENKPPPSHRHSKQPLDAEIENSIFPTSIENKVAVEQPGGGQQPVNDTDNAVPVFSRLPLPDREREWVRLCADNSRVGCEQLCLEVKGQPVCVCYRGFRQQGTKCEDIDECAVNNGGCEMGCQNVLGSYYCFCPPGLRLSNNDKTCTDVNECLLRNGHGPCQDTCTNTWGGYTCTCKGLPGTRLASNNHTCDDLDECAKNNAGCSHICLNTLGNAFCLCPSGFMLGEDWKTCHDIDECSTEDDPCPAGCVNTPGSYRCSEPPACPSGFEHGPRGCSDVDECRDDELCDQLCANTDGSFACSCKVGYMLAADKRSCKEVRLDAVCPPLDTPRHGYVVCMRLALSTGPWRHRIVNHSGSICELRCPAGYRITGLYRRFCGQSGRWLGPHYGSCDRLPTYY